MPRRAASLLDRVAASVPPSSGAVVMGTGIVSIGLAIDGRETLSRILLVCAVVVWVVLGVVLGTLLWRLRPLLRDWGRTPASLTAIAATNVLGARVSMLGWQRAAAVLLVLGTLLWSVSVPFVLAHWRRPTVGVSFVLTVSTESIAVLAALLAAAWGSGWLGWCAVAALGLGLCFYLFVLSGFELRQLLVGRGDHWVSGGALAIAALACGRCAEAAAVVPGLRPAAGGLETASVVLWAAAILWLPVLLVAELASRRGGYDARRWSTVFPLGMYAVCSFADGDVNGLGWLVGFARVWIWVAFAVWLVFFLRMLRRASAFRRPPEPLLTEP